MKKLFKGIWNLIKRHKLLFIICLMAFAIIVVMGYVFFSVFIGGTGKYGDRLKGIEKVEIAKKDLTELSKNLEEKDEVTEASARIQGKIIYINIVFTKDTTLSKAKEIANATLKEFDEDEQKFYDFGYFLTQEEKEDNTNSGFIVTGTKNASLNSISWIKS